MITGNNTPGPKQYSFNHVDNLWISFFISSVFEVSSRSSKLSTSYPQLIHKKNAVIHRLKLAKQRELSRFSRSYPHYYYYYIYIY